MSAPRLLVVTSGLLGAADGTGVTLQNLLGDWPVDRLAQVHTVPAAPDAAATSADRRDGPVRQYFFAPQNAPVDHVVRRTLSRHAPGPRSGAPVNPGVPMAASAPRAERLRAQMRAVADLSPLHYPADLGRFVAAFQPDVVYSLLGNVRMMRLATRVAQLADVPLVPHIMDDWPSALYAGGELSGRAVRARDRAFTRVLLRSRGGIAISDAMSAEYELRYRLAFRTFGNAVPDETFATAPGALPRDADGQATRPADAPVRFVYVGGLHLQRWRTLARLASAIETLPVGGRRAELVVHAPDSDLHGHGARIGRTPYVQLAGSLAQHEVAAALQAADVLVHVESFDEQVRRLTRLSLSTKIPQYLAAGRPLLAVGPGEAASVQHVRHAAVAVTEDADEPLVRAVSRLVNEPALRGRLAAAGYELAVSRHRRSRVRADLVDWLTECGRAPERLPVCG